MKNNNPEKKKHFTLYLLIFFNFFQSISGLWGGIFLSLYPSGNFMQMPVSFLEHTPFNDYLVPGIILFSLLGIFPLFVFYGLLFQPKWKWMNFLNIYKDAYWAWTYSLYIGIMLIIWIDIQIMLIGYSHFIQTFYALLGVIIVILTLLPTTIRYYRVE